MSSPAKEVEKAGGDCPSAGSRTQSRGVRGKRSVARGASGPGAGNPRPKRTTPAPYSDHGRGLAGSSQPRTRRSYLSSAPSYRAAGGGGRRRGLPALPSELPRAVVMTFSLGIRAPTSSSCTSGVRNGLKRHCARDSHKPGNGRGGALAWFPCARWAGREGSGR